MTSNVDTAIPTDWLLWLMQDEEAQSCIELNLTISNASIGYYGLDL
jgi:hypothetical protein